MIWSVNYARHLRASITGRIMINGSIAIALVGLLLGWLLEREGPWFAWRSQPPGLCGLAGGWAFRRLGGLDEEELLEAERDRLREGARFDLAGIRHLLATDADFRHYMLAMSLFGAGFLTLTPLMVIFLDDVLRASGTCRSRSRPPFRS